MFYLSSRFFFFFFLECGLAGRNDSAGGDGSRGLALPRAEDTDGRVRRRCPSKTRPRFRDLQRDRQEAGLSEYQRAQHASRGVRMRQRVPGESCFPKYARNAQRLDIAVQTRGDKTKRLLVAAVDYDKGGAIPGALQQCLQVRSSSTRTTRTSDQGRIYLSSLLLTIGQ